MSGWGALAGARSMPSPEPRSGGAVTYARSTASLARRALVTHPRPLLDLPVWLLPFFPEFSKLATTTFYRLGIAGGKVPAEGPVLLVANHPNSLMDPALVAAVAGRPVRFLAKAPLFTDPMVGWLVRGSGAIPVYRRADDEAEVAKNEDSFRAVYSVLAEGAAVAIFPEGHQPQPALAGAAQDGRGAHRAGRRGAAGAADPHRPRWAHLPAQGPLSLRGAGGGGRAGGVGRGWRGAGWMTTRPCAR